MDAHCEMLMEEFGEAKPSLEIIRDYVLDEIRRTLRENGIVAAVVEGRIKTEKSLAGKLELKGYKYKTISDITDLFGCRIVTFYDNEVDKVAALMEQMYDIDWDNSVDKRKMLGSDQFGYLSLHYICRIPKEKYSDPDHPDVNVFRFEIQMRTVLQHMWATAMHDTGYKSDIEVPREYIRSLNRLAGLLEIADKEFSTLIEDVDDYRRKVRAVIKKGKFEDLELNGDTFRDYIDLDPFGPLNKSIASINHAEIQPQSFMPYFKVFTKFEFKTLGDIEKMKKEYSDRAYNLAAVQITGKDIDILASTVGVQNLCIVWILAQGLGEAGIRLFFDMLYGPRPRNASSAKRMYELAKSINLCE